MLFGGWVSCMAPCPEWGGGPAWCGGAGGRQARACRGLYKLCLKRMPRVLLPVCKIETRVFGLSSGLLLLCRCAGMSSRDAGLWGDRAGGCEGRGWGRGPLGLPSTTQPRSTYQIRRLPAAAAAAARARVTRTLMKKGAEGPPPLPSSPGSQIFVVGGGARELVVLAVVSGEHGGNSETGRAGAGVPPPSGVHRHTAPASCVRPGLPLLSDSPCLTHQAGLCFPKAPGGPLHAEAPTENVQTARTSNSRGWTDRRECASHTDCGDPWGRCSKPQEEKEGGQGAGSPGAWASVVRCRGSSVQGVAWAATLQSLHVPISLSLAATWMMYSFPA